MWDIYNKIIEMITKWHMDGYEQTLKYMVIPTLIFAIILIIVTKVIDKYF